MRSLKIAAATLVALAIASAPLAQASPAESRYCAHRFLDHGVLCLSGF